MGQGVFQSKTYTNCPLFVHQDCGPRLWNFRADELKNCYFFIQKRYDGQKQYPFLFCMAIATLWSPLMWRGVTQAITTPKLKSSRVLITGLKHSDHDAMIHTIRLQMNAKMKKKQFHANTASPMRSVKLGVERKKTPYNCGTSQSRPRNIFRPSQRIVGIGGTEIYPWC